MQQPASQLFAPRLSVVAEKYFEKKVEKSLQVLKKSVSLQPNSEMTLRSGHEFRSLEYFEMDAQQTLKRNKDSSLTSLKKIIEVKQEIIERISL